MSNHDPKPPQQYRAGGVIPSSYQQPPGYAPPQQPGYGYTTPPPTPRKVSKLSWLIIGATVFVALIVVAMIAAPAEDETGTASDSTTPADAPAAELPAVGTAEGQDIYAIGQTATTGGADVTVHTVTDPYVDPNQFATPNDGMRHVAVEVTITNPTDQLVTWSSILGAELTDSANRGWNITFAGTDLPGLDGDIPIQGERRGWLVFEVAADSTGLVVRIKGNLTATGSLFQLTP